MLPYHTKITKYIFIFFLLLVLAYAIFEARNIIGGPVINIQTPPNGLTAKTSLVKISGSVSNVANIKLDGHPIDIDETGKFTEKLILVPGVNIFDFVARDKFGREKHKKIQIYYKAN